MTRQSPAERGWTVRRGWRGLRLFRFACIQLPIVSEGLPAEIQRSLRIRYKLGIFTDAAVDASDPPVTLTTDDRRVRRVLFLWKGRRRLRLGHQNCHPAIDPKTGRARRNDAEETLLVSISAPQAPSTSLRRFVVAQPQSGMANRSANILLAIISPTNGTSSSRLALLRTNSPRRVVGANWRLKRAASRCLRSINGLKQR